MNQRKKLIMVIERCEQCAPWCEWISYYNGLSQGRCKHPEQKDKDRLVDITTMAGDCPLENADIE